ncbi:MAG: RNHCP domain-containing protein [Micrococcales bacterium]|nr:MAG: RNHCP domain-containing protein [Micrococcales bacterium]PIE26828.1 MAG: RNHCP domain-containing protein [Micrococcales bacterium]
MARREEDTGFRCVACGAPVHRLGSGTYRDHCRHCLCSLHVDDTPGDRANDCRGILRPVAVDYAAAKGHIIVYRCESCGQAKRNKAAPDDDLDTILAVQRQAGAKLWE